ncbi:Bro-N domain-containing protein [[Clostridium] innocuum]|nr:Bro-N domain-containing protein [[Clostridium] innocuum]
MAELQIFKNDEFGEVRTTIIDGKPYFCGSDVAKALGYSDVHKAIKQNCDEEGWVTCRTLTNGGEQDVKFISEGNVHRLIVAASKQSKNKEIQNKAKKVCELDI